MIQRAIKKPVEIEFVRLTGKMANVRECLEFLGQKVDTRSRIACDMFEQYCGIVNAQGMEVHTLEGPITASIGDYIIKGTRGEFYPCKPDVFSDVYEVLNEQ